MSHGARPPTFARLVFDSLRYHWRTQLAVALGAAVGTAVLVGALLVGDSVRGSLRRLTLDRLGRVDAALVAPLLFRQDLADELAHRGQLPSEYRVIAPGLMMEASLAQPRDAASEGVLRANRVSLFAVDRRFWQCDLAPHDAASRALAPKEILLNRPLADRLRVKAGDDVLVRLTPPSDVPRDSALGRKTGTLREMRLRVRAVIAAEGLGRFSLRPDQSTPLNAYMNLADLQAELKRPNRINMLLVAGDNPNSVPTPVAHNALQAALRPTIEDFELEVTANPLGFFVMSSRRMMLAPPVETAAVRAAGERATQPALTYLANTIAPVRAFNLWSSKLSRWQLLAMNAAIFPQGETPYSTISAIDFPPKPPLGPLIDVEGLAIAPLADDEIVLNDWAARDLQVAVGDSIRIDYFEPESTHGLPRERSAMFRLTGIVALAGRAADRSLTPELPGVTDKESLRNWDPPFPFDNERVRPKDERYWKQYRTTPKAFVSLAAGRKLWGSRFGDTTSVRVAPAKGEMANDAAAEKLAEAWKPDPVAAGLAFQPIRAEGLAASSGTTPFEGLFLGFSMFLIISAVMLVALLFRLGVEQRAAEIGILLSIGWTRGRVRRWLLVEGLAVAMLGGFLGIGLGLGHAWLMLAGLRNWWVAAVREPFLQLHVTNQSLAVGYLCGVIASLVAILWGLWQLRHTTARQLLAGIVVDQSGLIARRSRWSMVMALVAGAGAIALSVFAGKLSGPAQAGAFFGAGFLILVAALALLWARLVAGTTGVLTGTGPMAMVRLALRNGTRFPSRSALTIGLMASASFLILAISAFRLDPPTVTSDKHTGSGGFALLAESDQPIYQNLNDADERIELAFSDRDDQLLDKAHTRFFPLRVNAGDDASCLNLYQVRQPRVLGAPVALREQGGFSWAASGGENPWLALAATDDPKHAVPVVLDQATAIYSLHLSGSIGDRLTITDGRGQPLDLVVVGLLQNSLLQGSLVMSEENLLRHFPDVSGYKYFLIDVDAADLKSVSDLLNRRLGDYGFDVRPTADVLAEFFAVQNTYLETFRSLGGLGLLLGTFGMAVVQLRSILERRRELALMQAVGFARGRLAQMVLFENTALLVTGLLVGTLAALVAFLPHLGVGHGAVGAAGVPWQSMAVTIGGVLAVGTLASLSAVRAVLVTPVLDGLRAE
ncbi:MAG: FtsX-like permease family protein [Planctomycetes bacterium]|nr:FtsX-like permease family protein [Planctomycetota bacterium]